MVLVNNLNLNSILDQANCIFLNKHRTCDSVTLNKHKTVSHLLTAHIFPPKDKVGTLQLQFLNHIYDNN